MHNFKKRFRSSASPCASGVSVALRAVVTIATVGYGDYYPVTTLGRMIAVFVMLSGIGIFVLLVSSLSSEECSEHSLG